MAPLIRKLGKNGPEVSALGLGCMGMSEFYGVTDEEENLKVLNRAIDLGCTFWDTADMYGIGENEKLLAKVLKTRRSEVFLCTKFGFVRDGAERSIRGDAEYVKAACDASLKRLDVDYIDLYYQHRVDPNTPIEETVKAMADLVAAGKVKYIGLSECSAKTLRRAYKVHPIAAIQWEYSPWTLDIETNGLLATCRELGVAIVAYSPLGRGFLTGRYQSPADFDATDFRKYLPRFSAENFPKNLELVKKFEELALTKKATISQLVLSWVLSQGEDFIAIPGTRKLKYLEENLGALDVSATKEDDIAIRQILSTFDIEGDRYPSQNMHTVNV